MSRIKRLEDGKVLWESTTRREISGGHATVVGGNYKADDAEVLKFVADKNPGFDNWFIRDYYKSDHQFFWMVVR